MASNTFTITAPNGDKYQVSAPPGTTQDQAEAYFRSKHSDLYDRDADLGADPGPIEDFFRTANQSLILDPIEGGAQLAASIPVVGPALQSAYNATPGSAATTKWLDDYKRRATRNDWQRAARVPMDVFNPLLMGLGPESALAVKGQEIAPAIASKWKSLTPTARTAAAGGGAAALQPSDKQPSFGEEMWKAGTGVLAGTVLGRILGATESRTAAEATAKNTQAKLEQTQKYNAKVAALNEKRRIRNNKAQDDYTKAQADALAEHKDEIAAAKKKHEGDKQKAWDAHQTAVDKWQTKADKIVAEHADAQADQDAAHAADLAAAKKEHDTALAKQEQEHQAALAQAQRDAKARAEEAKEKVPGDTVRQWWKEALTPTGDQGHAPLELSPETTAGVRDRIATRLNTLRSKMTFQPSEAIAKRLGVEKDKTSQELDPNDRGKWDATYLDLIGQPLAGDRPMTGKRLADYVSQIGKRAEDLVDAGRYTEARGLWRVQNIIEDEASKGDQALRRDLGNAKRGYQLWSIGNDAIKARKGGQATPADLVAAWERRQGTAAYGADKNPENVRLKRWLEQQRKAHQEPPPPTPAEVKRPDPAQRREVATPRPIPKPEVGRGIPLPPTTAPVPGPKLPQTMLPGTRPTAKGPRDERPLPKVPEVPKEWTPSTIQRLLPRILAYGALDAAGVPWYERYTAAAMADPKWIYEALKYLSRRPTATGAAVGQVNTDPTVQTLLGPDQ